jgi:hypothetical protein
MAPDYAGGSLLNLMASIAEACGAPRRHAPLVGLGAAELASARNVVLLVIDGLGDRFLARHGEGGELARRRRRAITSVFPSTTATAITTTYSAASPLEHGLTGWFTYFGEAACVGAPLPFISRGDLLPLQRRIAPEAAFRAPALFPSLARKSVVVTTRDIVDSTYNRHYCRGAERVAYDRVDELPGAVAKAVKSGAEPKFVYAYWPDYDRVSHRHGCESREALERLQAIDAAFDDLVRSLRGTDSVVLATADHGFVDVPAENSLELPSALAAQLRFPLCGERRVAYCHVQSPANFLADAKEWFGDRADVRPSAELLAEGWFGPGEAHPRFAERIGDVALVLRGRYTIKDWVAGEARHLHVGNHGGDSEDEMLVPLIVERT